jgi:glycosyltransferase involved in cell wall biosynthesis
MNAAFGRRADAPIAPPPQEGTEHGARIAVLNLNDTRRDPRVRRIGAAMQDLGHRVQVFEMRPDGLAERDEAAGLSIRRVPVATDCSKEAMAAIGRACPSAADVIRGCDAAVLDRSGGSTLARRVRWRERLRRLTNSVSREGRAPAQDFDQEIWAIRSIILINLHLFAAAKEFRPTLVYANDLDTLLAAFMLKEALGIPIVYDAHEIYPEQLAPHMRSEVWHRFYTNLEKRLIHEAVGRLTVCDSLGRYFAETYGAAGFTTVRNVPSRRHLPDPSILRRRPARRSILYQGSYFAYRGLDEIIDAAALIEADIVFRGIGAYETVLRRRAEKAGVGDRVRFEPPVAVTDLVASASACDIGLNPFVNVCKNTEYALPNKFFEYMMAGLAVASSDLVEMRQLTGELDVGVLFRDLEPRTIADALNALVADDAALERHRRNAYEAARTTFNWETERERFTAYFSQVAA